VKPSARFKTARYLTRWELCLDILDQLVSDVDALKRDRQYTGPRTAPIDDPSDPVHPDSQAQSDRLEAWALTTLDGDTQGVWFERESAEPIPGEEVQHRLVELREGEQIAPAGSVVLKNQGDNAWECILPKGAVVLTAEQVAKVRAAIRRAITHNVGTGLTTDDLAALGIEVDR